ncbi:hypothetical protein UK23_42470 [Lentzea aerocolonigenes]|uniref:ABC transporter ATP-binding protein n=1 Tax=Lentzea aerocolonigenes TaxID=68170 RepID=A0A0F0GDI6_LENAE|nr:hypothetical protein [Lentzea aerocolonigenes]KJK36090.1 hypothetical protein UK23_42470 [Lentzea aerocolonigenes]
MTVLELRDVHRVHGTGETVLRLPRSKVDAGAAAVLVTHDARHAAWADRVIFLRDGVLVDVSQRDQPEELLSTPALNVGYTNIWPQPDLTPLTIPWLNIAISLLAVPATTMLGAALFTRSRLPIERRE